MYGISVDIRKAIGDAILSSLTRVIGKYSNSFFLFSVGDGNSQDFEVNTQAYNLGINGGRRLMPSGAKLVSNPPVNAWRRNVISPG